MRKLFGAGIGLLALGAAMLPAAAADLPVKAPVYKAPVLVDPWSWNGFYIGLNGGYSWGRSRTDVQYFSTVTGLPIVPPAGSITSADFNLNGGVFGGQIGYNWQASASWLLGVEADLQWTSQRGSGNFLCAVANPQVPGPCLGGLTFVPPGTVGTALSLDQRLQWFGTVRGRLGVLVTPTVLAYATGGLAYGHVKTDATLTGLTPALVASTVISSSSTTRAGWTAGVGIEGKLWDHWTGKLEYLYLDLGTITGSVANPAIGVGANYSSRITDNIFRAGINYHFAPGPVVARY